MRAHSLSLLASVALSGFLAPAQAQTQLQFLWNVTPGTRAYVSTGDTQRGMAYNPATDHVLVVNRGGGLSVNIVNAATGADIGTLNTNGVNLGTFLLNQIGVADDGTIYAANLQTSTSGTALMRVYRWANEGAAPTVAYEGTVVGTTGLRWGDNLAVRGSGNNVQIAMGQGGSSVGNRIAVFTSSDGGITVAPTVFTYSAGTDFALGDTRGGLAFGEGSSLYFKVAAGTTLRYATFDLGAGTSTVLGSITMPAGLSGFGPLGSDPASRLLAGIQISTAATPTPQQQVYLFDTTTALNPVTLDFEGLLNPGNQNLNAAGAADFGNNVLFALDTNNGLWAFSLVPEPSTYALLALGGLVLTVRRLRRRA